MSKLSDFEKGKYHGDGWNPAFIKRDLAVLDEWLSEWIEAKDRILSDSQIKMLRVIAEKNIKGDQLTGAQREMKSQIHQLLRASLVDIERMIQYGFIGSGSHWDPSYWKPVESKLLFSKNLWQDDFPVGRIALMVKCVVSMFGEGYAIPLADAIEQGLNEDLQEKDILAEVPVIMSLRHGGRPRTKASGPRESKDGGKKKGTEGSTLDA